MSAAETAVGSRHKQGGGYAWLVWVLAALFVVFLFSIQTGYAIINPHIGDTLHLSIGQIGLVAAAYTWIFAVFQFFGGAFLDLLGARKVLTTALAIVAAGVIVIANANSMAMLLVAQFLLAVGSCVGFVGAGFVGGDWFGMAKFSVMFGLVQFVAAVTSAFAQGIFTVALENIDWRTLYWLLGGIGIGLLVLFLVFFRDFNPHGGKGEGQRTSFGDFARNFGRVVADVVKVGHVWMAAVGGGFTFAAILALGVVWAPRMIEAHGVSTSTADLATSMVWLGLGLGSLVIPRASDWLHNRKWIISVGNAAQLAVLLLIVFIPTANLWFLFGLTLLFGIFNSCHMLAFSTAADVVPVGNIGQASALVNGVMFVAGGLLMILPGKIVQTSDWTMADVQVAFIPIIAALVIALVVGLIMKETYPKSPVGS